MKRNEFKKIRAVLNDKLLRLNQVLELVPVSASTWWTGCREGRFPEPLHISKRVTAWKASDVKRVLNGKTEFSRKEKKYAQNK